MCASSGRPITFLQMQLSGEVAYVLERMLDGLADDFGGALSATQVRGGLWPPACGRRKGGHQALAPQYRLAGKSFGLPAHNLVEFCPAACCRTGWKRWHLLSWQQLVATYSAC